VQLDGPAPSFAGVAGVVDAEPRDGGVRLSVAGPPTALLAELARLPVVSLRSREADLEHEFLSYYGVEDRRGARASWRVRRWPRHGRRTCRVARVRSRRTGSRSGWCGAAAC
jgi:hypothetical protein